MHKDSSTGAAPSNRLQSDWFGLWILLALGLLLMLAAAVAGADESGLTVRRTDRFNGSLSAGSSLRVENVSGDITAAPGKEFSAVVTISASASTRQKAEELLRATTVLQKREGEDLVLRSIWPYSERSDGKSSGRLRGDSNLWVFRRGGTRCEDCKITAQYQVTIPAGVRAVLHTVNGEVRADGLDGELDVQSVNGAVRVRGARRGVSAESVNGKIDVAMQSLPPSASLHANTVNGSVLLTLPKDAKFDLVASTMNGTISSTFPLPARLEGKLADESPRPTEAPSEPRSRSQRRVVVQREEDEVLVDVEALQKEIEESMKHVDAEVRNSLREGRRELRRWTVFDHREYSGSTGPGGGTLHVTTLNGSIVVLAAGTQEAEARALVPERRGFAVTIPQIRVHPKPVVRVAPHALVMPGESEDSVVRGDVTGDFLATSGGGTYRIGRVSGNVKILTHSGQIHVASAGAGADLKSYGGDIHIGAVTGDLKAQTLAGEIRAGAVSGSIALVTSGGDIRVESAGASAEVRTGGGDIVLRGVRGSVEAKTGGGDVRVAILAREVKGGVSIQDSGGDVTLILPADFRGDLDLLVQDAESEETLIRSEFPQVTVTRQAGSQRGSGVLNGGGARVVVRTQSGTIRIRKGPGASD